MLFRRGLLMPPPQEFLMIARRWSARTTTQNWPTYEEHFTKNVLPELRAVDGYVSSNLLKRDAGGDVEITVITFWRSLECIDAFAEPDREAAVVAPSAAALLLDYDRRVRHYDLALVDKPANSPATTM
jgi:heme-degrading monooxygenase HmoA